MDRMRACGVCDVGSIPTEGTSTKKDNCLALCRKRKAFVYFLETLCFLKIQKVYCSCKERLPY